MASVASDVVVQLVVTVAPGATNVPIRTARRPLIVIGGSVQLISRPSLLSSHASSIRIAGRMLTHRPSSDAVRITSCPDPWNTWSSGATARIRASADVVDVPAFRQYAHAWPVPPASATLDGTVLSAGVGSGSRESA